MFSSNLYNITHFFKQSQKHLSKYHLISDPEYAVTWSLLLPLKFIVEVISQVHDRHRKKEILAKSELHNYYTLHH